MREITKRHLTLISWLSEHKTTAGGDCLTRPRRVALIQGISYSHDNIGMSVIIITQFQSIIFITSSYRIFKINFLVSQNTVPSETILLPRETHINHVSDLMEYIINDKILDSRLLIATINFT